MLFSLQSFSLSSLKMAMASAASRLRTICNDDGGLGLSGGEDEEDNLVLLSDNSDDEVGGQTVQEQPPLSSENLRPIIPIPSLRKKLVQGKKNSSPPRYIKNPSHSFSHFLLLARLDSLRVRDDSYLTNFRVDTLRQTLYLYRKGTKIGRE